MFMQHDKTGDDRFSSTIDHLGFSFTDIVSASVELKQKGAEYDVEPDQAEADLVEFVRDLVERGLLAE